MTDIRSQINTTVSLPNIDMAILITGKLLVETKLPLIIYFVTKVMDVNKLDIHSFLKLRNMIANCIGKKSSLQL